MPFFEFPPSAPEPEPEPCTRRPIWLGPPENVLGAGCALVAPLLARTDDVALGVTGIVAFPTGFSFVLALRRRVPSPSGYGWGDPWHRPPTSGEPAPEVLRFGIGFSDGRKATTLDGFPDVDPSEPDQLPPGPVLIHSGGSGGDGWAFDQGYWVWPLPPPGPLAFVCEWPAEGIPLTRIEVDAAELIAAAEQADLLWPASTDGGGAWTSY